MRGIQKETSRSLRNRNQYLYVRSIGSGCWGTCPTASQGSEWLSRKIPRPTLWTSSSRTAWHHRPKWIFCPSESFLGDQKLHNHRERGLDRMEGDQEPPTCISTRVPWLCWPYEDCIVMEQNDPTGFRTTLCYTCNDIVTGLHIPDSRLFLF